MKFPGWGVLPIARRLCVTENLRYWINTWHQKIVELQDIKVVLRNVEGRYVAGSAVNWEFVEDRCRAIVFDYFSQRVEDKIAFLRNSRGLVLEAERVPSNEVYETCDLCNGLVMPLHVFFDGAKFLCPACSAKRHAKSNTTLPPSGERTRLQTQKVPLTR